MKQFVLGWTPPVIDMFLITWKEIYYGFPRAEHGQDSHITLVWWGVSVFDFASGQSYDRLSAIGTIIEDIMPQSLGRYVTPWQANAVIDTFGECFFYLRHF